MQPFARSGPNPLLRRLVGVGAEARGKISRPDFSSGFHVAALTLRYGTPAISSAASMAAAPEPCDP
jgi:hypothetical protein